jgi:hypothetical protein
VTDEPNGDRTVDRKPVQKFNDRNELYFECSNQIVAVRFQFAVRDPKQHSQNDWAEFEAQITESFESAEFRQPR